jgi:hypothetical protein
MGNGDQVDCADSPAERGRRADIWEAAADERERLSNERESVADEREWLADERDRLIDQREHTVDRLLYGPGSGPVGTEAELAAVREAVRRAEPGLGRAEEDLARARQAAARAQSRALRGAAAGDRAAAVEGLRLVHDLEELGWLLDRRDFVAAERDLLADDRDTASDRRDEAADQREDLADERDQTVPEREQGLLARDGTGRRIGSSRLTPGADQWARASRRDQDRERRARAGEQRAAAAEGLKSAAAQWGPEPYGPHLLAGFAELTRRLFALDDRASALAQALDYAVAVVPGCDGASLTLWQRESVFDTLATNPDAAQLDKSQIDDGEGPIWQVMQDGGPVNVPDLPHDGRWPAMAARAAELGVSQVLCHGLVGHGGHARPALGSFTLFSCTPGAFGEAEQEFATILAAYLAVAVVTEQRSRDIDRREAALHRALSSRDVIGQAKGILMERQGLTAPQAFDVLRRASQRLNLRLNVLAELLTQNRTLPGETVQATSTTEAFTPSARRPVRPSRPR